MSVIEIQKQKFLDSCNQEWDDAADSLRMAYKIYPHDTFLLCSQYSKFYMLKITDHKSLEYEPSNGLFCIMKEISSFVLHEMHDDGDPMLIWEGRDAPSFKDIANAKQEDRYELMKKRIGASTIQVEPWTEGAFVSLINGNKIRNHCIDFNKALRINTSSLERVLDTIVAFDNLELQEYEKILIEVITT